MTMNNKTLSIIAVALFPFVVISFVFKSDETNFNLDKSFGPDIPNGLLDDNSEVEEYTVRVLVNGETEVLPLEDYVVGVVAGEMPASFDIEALKAQAIASRTYALYKKQSNVSAEYDLTDNTNTQVYLSIESMQNKWGSDFQKYYDKISSAVESTKGQVITYEGEIIEAFYFAMSGGHTLEASQVFNESREYLKGVDSIYDNANLKNYEVVTEFEKQDFKNKLSISCENIIVNDIKKNDEHHVESLSVCGTEFKGTTFRTTLGLRSTNFDIEVLDKIKITTRGYGHGVGMSQYGANGYAEAGYSYEDIIKHYYTNVEIKDIKNV